MWGYDELLGTLGPMPRVITSTPANLSGLLLKTGQLRLVGCPQLLAGPFRCQPPNAGGTVRGRHRGIEFTNDRTLNKSK
jgi:hypothetical protein